MASKLFISAKEVAKELEVSDSYAYRLIRQLNRRLFFKIEKLREKMIKIKAALIWQLRKSICVLEPDDSAWK